MTPSVWVMVKSMPLGPTGKLYRKRVVQWLAKLSDSEYQAILGQVHSAEDVKPATDAEAIIQAAVASALGMPVDKVSLGRSFLSLGGDSITAMRVMSTCRAQGIKCDVRDILQRKRLSDIADSRTVQPAAKPNVVVEEGTLFPITPIQHLFNEKINHNCFLQEVVFEVHGSFSISDFKNALTRLVKTHAMLRAKLVGDQQLVTPANDACYHLSEFTHRNTLETAAQLDKVRGLIDFRIGPVFAGVVLRTESSADYLYMAAHHAVVDEVSWSTIREDLESLLTKKTLSSEPTLPMQGWAVMPRDYALKNLPAPKSLGVATSNPPHNYWGHDYRNTLEDVSMQSFRLNKTTTSSLMNECNIPVSTQPLDIMLAAVIQSFSEVFSDRNIPAVFTEGHGREPWEDGLDVSRTVGWFTTM